MGGRGSSAGQGRFGGGGGLAPSDILSTEDMISYREKYESTANGVMQVAQDMYDEYGDVGLKQYNVATLAPSASGVLGYYDGSNIGMNKTFMNNSQKLNDAYDECVKSGFHPSRGNKTGVEAVAAHEFGHALTDAAGRKMGIHNIDKSADRIVSEARKQTTSRGVVQMANKISRYASHSNAECIAEAVADVYCNGSKAHAESKAVVSVLKSYL